MDRGGAEWPPDPHPAYGLVLAGHLGCLYELAAEETPMNTPFRPAQTLAEVARQATLEPLPLGDPRYVDLSAGQATRDLVLLRQYIEEQSADERSYALAAFSGHRGCGKTTQLVRLENDLAPRFTAIHVFADETLLQDPDLDYPDLMLWLVDELVREFDRRGHSLDERLVADVVDWFAARTEEDVTALRNEAKLEAEAEAAAKTGLYFVSLKMLARIKSIMQGSVERRQTIRRELQRYSADLLNRVNELLDGAARVLERNGKSPDLLIVQDNLDRLGALPAERLFIENGDLLGRLNAHAIYTAPVAMVLSRAANTGQVFEHGYTLPMVKVQQRNGRAYSKGVEALIALIAARADLGEVFVDAKVPQYLARMSGGSVRDLIRLLYEAQSFARVDGKDRIDQASARDAAQRVRLSLERTLWPYKVLAGIHKSKSLPEPTTGDPQQLGQARAFYADLLIKGVVLEYDGGECWYDVHPIMREIPAFKDALKLG
jgi:hypothetical protein